MSPHWRPHRCFIMTRKPVWARRHSIDLALGRHTPTSSPRVVLWWYSPPLRFYRGYHPKFYCDVCISIVQVWRACNLTSFSPCLTGPVDYLFASRQKGPSFKSPQGYIRETGILLLAMSRYIGDPDVIDIMASSELGFIPKPSLGHRADNVMIPLDLTQLSCPGFTLATGLPSGFTTNGVGC
jgi:hypothetical protein